MITKLIQRLSINFSQHRRYSLVSNFMSHDINRFKVATLIDSAGACPGTHPCYWGKAWVGKGLGERQSWAGLGV